MATSGTPGASDWRKFLAADWSAWMVEYPETATIVGFPGQNGRWTDDSPTGIDARKAHLGRSLATVTAVDRARLEPSERLNYDLYRELLESAVEGLRFGFDPYPFRAVMAHSLYMPISQMDGVHLTAPDILYLQPRGTVAEAEQLLDRLAALPAALDQQLGLMRAGLERGYSPPRIAVRGAPAQVAGLLVDAPTENPLLLPVTELPGRIPAGTRDELLGRATEQFRSSVRPAIERLHRYLTEEYLPACRESIAATALPDGAPLYAYAVRWQTTSDLSAAQIHAIGLAEVERIRGEMESVLRRTGFSGSLREFNEFLRTDPRFRWDTAEALIDGYRAIGKRIDPALGLIIGRLPRSQYGVLPVPEFRAPSSPAAYYQSGAPATGRPGYFFANTYDLRARFRWEMEALALHEAVPGHHLQISLGQEADDVPDFRRFAGYGAFVEGWGLYAESLGEELGMYSDPYSKFGQLTYDMWRSIRLVVDTGMHALGWSRDRAIEFFRERTGKSDLDIAFEVDRYIVWPGQALAYKIGQLKIRELRGRAEQRLGERFDVRAFHDRVLEQSAVPLGVLERRIDDWIDRVARGAA